MYGQKPHLTVSPVDFKFEGDALQTMTGAAPDKIGRSLPLHPPQIMSGRWEG